MYGTRMRSRACSEYPGTLRFIHARSRYPDGRNWFELRRTERDARVNRNERLHRPPRVSRRGEVPVFEPGVKTEAHYVYGTHAEARHPLVPRQKRSHFRRPRPGFGTCSAVSCESRKGSVFQGPTFINGVDASPLPHVRAAVRSWRPGKIPRSVSHVLVHPTEPDLARTHARSVPEVRSRFYVLAGTMPGLDRGQAASGTTRAGIVRLLVLATTRSEMQPQLEICVPPPPPCRMQSPFLRTSRPYTIT